MQGKQALYFTFAILSSNILIVFLSYTIISYFQLVPNEESPKYSRNQAILQLIVTTILTFLVSFELISVFFPAQFSFFVDESKDTQSFKTLKNLEKINADPQLITYCFLIGFLVDKLFIVFFEFLTSNNEIPTKNLIRSCESGPCFNLISAKVLHSFAFPLSLFAISLIIFAGYGILGYFGIALIALGGIANIITVYSINMVAALGNHANKLNNFVKFHELVKEKCHNLAWYPQNYRGFLRGSMFLALALASFAATGNFICALNSFNVIILKSLQIFGLILGFAMPSLLNAVLVNSVMFLNNNLVNFLILL